MLAHPTAPDESTYEVNVIPMNFRVEHIPIHGKPGEFREVHSVDLVKKGSNGESTPWTIPRLQQDQILWPAIKPFYARWLEGQEDPEEGTPIDCLPFLPVGLVPHLRLLHIRSAEDLAGVTDADLERIGQGSRMWREKTRAYLDAKAGGAVAVANAELKVENERLGKELEELKAQVNSLVAVQQGEAPVEQPVKRKGGWPKGKPRGPRKKAS